VDISDFQLERSIFEFRYSPSYIHWDRAGVLWNDAQIKWPKLKIKRGEPNVTSFTLDDTYEIAITIDKASVVCYYPKADLVDFIEKVDYFLAATTKQLEIRQYARIGLRLLFFKVYADKESASAGVLEPKLVNLPDGPHFGLEGSFSLPELAVRWEGLAAGVTLRLRSEGRKIDFDPPMGVRELQPYHEEKFGILYDLDYYTKGTLGTGQFRTQDWINNVLHVVRRDSRKFLGA
jgi:hypothetical protein